MIKGLGLNYINEIIDLIWNVQIDSKQIPSMFINEESKEFFKNSVLKKINSNLKFYGFFIEEQLVGLIGTEENNILYLYVLKEYQNNKIGTKLIKFVLELLKDYETINIDSTDESKEFYRKNGFVEKKNFYDISMEYKKIMK